MQRRDLLKYLGASAVALHPTVRALSSGEEHAPPESAGIFLNQLGYLPTGRKQATIRAARLDRRDFQVRSSPNNQVVFAGRASVPRSDAASGDQTSIADFSGLQHPGQYRLTIGGTDGDLFSIADDAYADALRMAMRGFYGQRCGCAVDLGDGYKHPACHATGAYHPSSGKSGAMANHGGWHDAGDYGRYVVNSGIATGTLLWAWELYPRILRRLSLSIPESGGKLPDFLAEVRWNLEWMLSMQDLDGGVWHKQTSEQFCRFVMPQDDSLTSYVIGTGNPPFKSTCASADLAAVMAIAARCYSSDDAAFSQRCLIAARRAWSWVSAHPDVSFHNPPTIATGEYGDARCGDEICWASAELWRTTGEPQYEKAFLAQLPDAKSAFAVSAPSWSDLLSMAYWTYALAERPGDAGARSRITDATVSAAGALIERSAQNGYGNTLAPADYVWGSNGVAGNQSLLLAIADRLRPDRDAREAALNNLHYMLGRNCHGVSWVTQVGRRPFAHPHHRPSVADGIAAPWPGLLAGGPNAHGGDPVADKLPAQPPMKMWLDDTRAFTLNEIAINWNAPLVFLLAAANA